jgi:hypothetical protein
LPASLGQQGDDGVDLVPLEGIGEPVHELLLPRVGDGPQHCFPALLRQPFLDGVTGAEECAVNRCDRGLERLCRLLGGKAEHVAQNEYGPLTGGEVLQHGYEGELERLAPLVASLGRRVAVRAAERLLRVRLDPRSDRQRLFGRGARTRPRPIIDRRHALATVGERVEADVGSDPVQPSAKRASAPEPG